MTELTIQKNNASSNQLWWKPFLHLQEEFSQNFKHLTSKLNPLMPSIWDFEEKIMKQVHTNTHKLFSEMFNNRQMYTPWALGTLTEPYINIIENGNKYKIQADVPGATAHNLKISTEDNQIVIKGSHRTEEEEDGDAYIRRECHSGSFTRRIALPEDADIENAKAHLEQSVLYINVPKLEGSKKPATAGKKTLFEINQPANKANKQKAA